VLDRSILNLTIVFCWAGSLGAAEIDFNRDIRPILSENCYYCHGQDGNQRQADLRLDVREAAVEAGAIVPGDVAASAVRDRIRSEDADSRMPPVDSNRRLSEQQKQLLEQWIAEGAAYQNHWAFETPSRPHVPQVRDEEWPKGAIDRFVLAKLDGQGWAPSPPAERATLIKRLYADLIGLPPTPDEVAAFVADRDPLAYEQLVERLLNSWHYGERMALPWLDAARYADSNGFQQDGDTWQWMWRDWVVRALNADMPFDQFSLWQLAGDLLPEATVDQMVASGFNRNHLLNGEGGAIAEEQRFNVLFDRVDTTATNWLGLTLACAQCHDHKYDPITQRDYYQMLDAFNHVPETGTPQRYSSRIRLGNPVIELPTPENQERIADLEQKIAATEEANVPLQDAAFQGWRLAVTADGNDSPLAGLSSEASAILQKKTTARSDDEQQSLDNDLRKLFDKTVLPKLANEIPSLKELDRLTKQLAEYRADQIPRVMVMSDSKARETHILERGAYLQPTEQVSFDTPNFLLPMPEDFPKNRLGFARWLFLPEHPLTARVQVNRMWQHYFGSGIVKTAEDFGVQSEYPLHKDLLDWLAVEFQESGWSMKHMHRLIVCSATYRQTSRISEEQLERDAENRWYARAGRFRMPSMVLRDWALSASGLLGHRLGGVPVYPYQPEAAWEALAITKERDFTYPQSAGADLYRRSLYTFWRRTVSPANMFDASNRQTCRVRLATTSTPLHALTTLNDPTWIEAARMLAQESLLAQPTLDEQLQYLFQRIVCRPANSIDMRLIHRAYEKQFEIYSRDPQAALELLQVGAQPRNTELDASQHAALTAVSLAVFNTDEALTRE
jgi:hypothetical protein